MKKAVLAMATGATIAVAVLTVTICGYYAPFFPPARYRADTGTPADCKPLSSTDRPSDGSLKECLTILAEARALRANPGIAARDGDILRISYPGQKPIDLVPAVTGYSETWQTCDRYVFTGALILRDGPVGRPDNVARILCRQGDYSQNMLLLPSGERFLVPQVSSSADGALLATGSNEPYETGREGLTIDKGRLTLIAWPDRRVVARFAPGCRVLNWRDAEHFSVTCIALLGSDLLWEWGLKRPVFFDADVTKYPDGTWQMQATRWLNPTTDQHTAFGDLQLEPLWSTRPLPHFIAATE